MSNPSFQPCQIQGQKRYSIKDIDIFLNHPHWQGVEKILKTLQKGGFEAYLVGGCVRDLVLSLSPKDFDVATSATPQEVEKLFPSVLPLGKAFFTMSHPFPLSSKKNSLLPQRQEERSDKKKFYMVDIVTFRSEKGQVGHRYPKEWALATFQEDVLRRDFTINALLFHRRSQEILDLVGGMEDLKKKRVVAIGEARERFYEDALRMLRAFRFAAELGFHLESKTKKALTQQASLIQNISRERIAKELRAFLNAPYLHKIWEVFIFSGMAPQLMPHLPWKKKEYRAFLKESWKRDLKREKNIFLFRLAVLHLPFVFSFSPFSSKEDLKVMERHLFTFWNHFGWSSHLKREWVSTLKCLPLFLSENLKYGKSLYLLHRWPLLFPLLVCWSCHKKDASSKELSLLRKRIQKGKKEISKPLPKPFVNGKDLLNLGFPPRFVLGEVLKKSYYLQLEKTLLSRQETLNWLKSERDRILS